MLKKFKTLLAYIITLFVYPARAAEAVNTARTVEELDKLIAGKMKS